MTLRKVKSHLTSSSLHRLSYFEAFVDDSKMRDLLPQHIPAAWLDNYTIQSCQVADSRLKVFSKVSSWPKSTLSVLYCFEMIENNNAQASSQNRKEKREQSSEAYKRHNLFIYAKVFAQGSGAAAWRKLRKEMAHCHWISEHIAYCAELDMIVWRFPADPVLHHLACLHSGSALERELAQKLVDVVDGAQLPLLEYGVTVLKYRPEVRCTVRVQLKCTGPTGASTKSVIVKLMKDESGKRIYCWMSSLHQQRTSGNQALNLPKLLAYNESTQTLWLEDVDGLDLQHVLAAGHQKTYFTLVARGLAQIHNSALPEIDIITQASVLLTELQKKIGKLAPFFPDLVDRLMIFGDIMQESAPKVDTGRHKVLHGDFHLAQILVRDNELVFLDFDSLTRGDPELDLAEFLVALYFYGYSIAYIQECTQHLLTAYAACTSWTIEPSRLLWYARYEYLNRAYRYYQQHRPGWREQLQKALCNVALVDEIILQKASQ